jgi:REP element-mobilizing transposase RayT
MTNHLHLICRSREGFKISEILRDFKKFTSKQLIQEIKMSNESRSEWLLDKFSFEARRTRRAKDYKVWQDSNHAIELSGYIGYEEKLDYIHHNPVKGGWVFEPQDFVYSGAIDYCGGKGLVNVSLL